jgi:small-conductance mechanosensitive channel/CRP-like cAMP-binding protein
MTPHALWSAHVIWGLVLAAGAAAGTLLAPDASFRRRLRTTLIIAIAALATHLARVYVPAVAASPHQHAIANAEWLILALAVINGGVALGFNRWRGRGGEDRTPSIVQDTIVVTLLGVVATMLLGERVWAASFGAAAAIALALQEQLGNLFAGLAVQIEKPFRVGHWIAIAGHEGRVVEVTWRATKVRTKTGNLIIIPNNVVAKESISNYSEPIAPTQEYVEVGATYLAAPNQVREALLAAMGRVSRVLTSPAPDVVLASFGDSAIVYRARYWLIDFEHDVAIGHDVRTAIYYEFQRRGIEIPWPIQIQYERQEAPADSPERRERFARTVAAVPVLAPLPPAAHEALAAAAIERTFGDGEVIVREGEPGRSMFIVRTGRVAITLGPDRREVAVTEAGGYFGEMSLLTGDPRTATVLARGDCTVLELEAESFGAYIRSHPEAIDRLATAAAERRRELDASRAAPGPAAPPTPASLAQRMRRFFGL